MWPFCSKIIILAFSYLIGNIYSLLLFALRVFGLLTEADDSTINNKSMHILYLHRIWPVYGGGETVTKCLANELIHRGHQVSVLCTKRSERDDSDLDSHIYQEMIPNVKFDENSSEFFVDKAEAKIVSEFLISFVTANQVDVIINQWWPIEFLGDINKTTSTKVIKCLHMDPDTKKVLPKDGLKGKIFNAILPFYRIMERRKHLYSLDKYLFHSDLLIFLAPSFLKFYRSQRPNDSRVHLKTDFIFNPLVYEVEESVTMEEKTKTVLFVGRLLEKHKQVSRILKAWCQIEGDHGFDDWNLKIVGDGPDRDMYENMICSLGLKRVSMEGFQNPQPYYRKASIGVITSAYEGFPMSLVESQQTGVVPVAMNSYASVYDIIENGKNGLIVNDGDIDSFALALKELMLDKGKRESMARKGFKSCERYSTRKVVDKWEKIFNDITK